MPEMLFDKNMQYLKKSKLTVYPNNNSKFEANQGMRHFISNSLEDLDHELTDEDVIFTFSNSSDEVKKEVVVTNADTGLVSTETTNGLDALRIGILTKDDYFFEYVFDKITDSCYLSGIKKVSIELIEPDYVSYRQDIPSDFKEYTPLDHLSFILKGYHERITLHGHEYMSNKSIRDIYLNFFSRLK
ncbi:hypothetical protein NGC65_10615 [Staphylococcus xylosus]|uniref:hypothetical protein n=1 Tax=Staphylococcus xylosus TaxID=1288 RepID=UPI002DB7A796|nr:hypothetical protein [Staphylococcus xylosus]MEB7865894.1 hypothetical protein [Staphylococcus xylosus]